MILEEMVLTRDDRGYTCIKNDDAYGSYWSVKDHMTSSTLEMSNEEFDSFLVRLNHNGYMLSFHWDNSFDG